MNDALKSLKPLEGSKIYFFKNGKCQGEAFENIYGGAYYPSISVHKSATVKLNFGPNFNYPKVLDDYKCKGVSVESSLVAEDLNNSFSRCLRELRNSFASNLWLTCFSL